MCDDNNYSNGKPSYSDSNNSDNDDDKKYIYTMLMICSVTKVKPIQT